MICNSLPVATDGDRNNEPNAPMTTTAKIKPVKIGSHKSETTYRIGKWLVTVERKTSKSYACGSSKTQSWTQWSAINMENLIVSENKSGMGGIKQAVEKLG
jgi:hypothetical protein